MKEKLIGKKILLLSVQYFNYEKAIINQLLSFGAKVDYYDERPANSLFAKGIIRIKRSIYQKKIDRYYETILKRTEAIKYDYLFAIRGEVIPAFFLERFKQINPDCILLFYNWDSFKNHGHAISNLKYFDKCYTFDESDAKKYNINFAPLFFIEEYGQIYSNHENKYKYDLLFLGTAHSDRYKISLEIVNWCNSQNLTNFNYYYMQSRLVYFYKKIFDSTFQDFDYRKLSFSSLSIEEILDLYKQSNVILDINHPHQSGLTMRTFEALGAGKKVITTNSEIKRYPFYNENNILIIDRLCPVLKKDFFETPFTPIDDHLHFKMSISGWIQTLFDDNLNYWSNSLKNVSSLV